MAKDKKKKRVGEKMVGWYDWGQLKNTAAETAISTLVGEYADPRLGTAEPPRGEFLDYSEELGRTEFDFEAIKDEKRSEIWIDYVADVGDGWNPTYAVASKLAQSEIKIPEILEPLQRGEVLILGGDGVYPTAHRDVYERRLVVPYRMAFKKSGTVQPQPPPHKITLKEEPHIFALPGNHDWYDSLVSFRKLFCSHIFHRRKFACDKQTLKGGWRTRQKGSYFALKLPGEWWLLGVDLQLTHNIDVSQLQYFESIVEQMNENDKVILCVPEPYWVKAIKYEGITDKFDEKEDSIEKLESLFGINNVNIKVYIAGDLHHYRRFEDFNKVQKITAGGGGAFMHPTHDFDFNKHKKIERIRRCFRRSNKLGIHILAKTVWNNLSLEFLTALKNSTLDRNINHKTKGFSLRKDYPDFNESKKLDWKNFTFLLHNKWFGWVSGILYAFLAWLIRGELPPDKSLAGDSGLVKTFQPAFHNLVAEPLTFLSVLWLFFLKALGITINRIIEEPLAGLIVVVVLLGLVFFTDSNSSKYKWIAGLIHGFAHLTAIFLLGWLGYLLSVVLIEKYGNAIPISDISVWFLCVVAVCFFGGWIISSIIMGLYLFVSLHIFGRHDNEAFSALKIQDYKNFLRLHIDASGDLTIYPIKIERVPRAWKPIPDDKNTEFYEPESEIDVKLIEDPIHIKSN